MSACRRQRPVIRAWRVPENRKRSPSRRTSPLVHARPRSAGPVTRATSPTPQALGDQRPEARDPDPDRLVGDAIWLYLRFTLSLRDVEELLAERGIIVLDDGLREPEAAVRCRLHASRLLPHRASSKPELTSPHGRYVAFQMTEVAVPRTLFAEILRLIAELRPPPDPAPA